MLNRFFVTICLGFLASCAPEGPAFETIPGGEQSADTALDTFEPTVETPPLLEECDASDYRPLIGSSIGAVTLPADPMLRVYSVNDIIPQDYRPRRTNIILDSEGTIRRVTCG